MAVKPGSSQHMTYYQKFATAAYLTETEKRQLVPAGFHLDTDLSNRNRAVYYNPETYQVILAERGSKLQGKTAVADLATDAALAMGFGEQTSRFRNAMKLAKVVQEKYEGWTFETTGHSLGGSIAKSLHDNLDLRATVFSAHLPTTQILQQAFQTKMNNAKGIDTLHGYTVKSDPIGAGMFLAGSAFAVTRRVQSPHSLENFAYQ
jgi:hypothetical protein